MTDEQIVNRLKKLAVITQTFYSPPVYDSSYAITLPFKVAVKAIQALHGTGVTLDEMQDIVRQDVEKTIRRQTDSDARAWTILKRKKELRKPGEDWRALQAMLIEEVRAFTTCFFEDIVMGICGSIDDFLTRRKRLQAGYEIAMKDIAEQRWLEEGWRMFREQPANKVGVASDSQREVEREISEFVDE